MSASAMAERVKIVEVGPRDGLQNDGAALGRASASRAARALAAARA